MPIVNGPDTVKLSAWSGVNGIEVWDRAPEAFPGSTLGEVLAAYSAKYGCTFEAYDGSHPDFPFVEGELKKYFWYRGYGKSRQSLPESEGEIRYPIDIHINRENEIFCPKQDLSIEVLSDDVVEIDVMYIC